VDRERRARAVSALGRSRIVLLVVTAAMSLSGCRNRKEEARQKAELTTALGQFQAQIGELLKQASGLRARFDKLPEDLPGIGPVRDDLHALEEGLGVEDGRAKWLSGQLDNAFASGKKEEIEKVSKAIPRGDGGMSPIIVKVTHELVPLERLAAQRHFFEALDAEKARAAQQEAQKQRPPKAR
jgi:hypothetical protein